MAVLVAPDAKAVNRLGEVGLDVPTLTRPAV